VHTYNIIRTLYTLLLACLHVYIQCEATLLLFSLGVGTMYIHPTHVVYHASQHPDCDIDSFPINLHVVFIDTLLFTITIVCAVGVVVT
jgi:hypothetical protein